MATLNMPPQMQMPPQMNHMQPPQVITPRTPVGFDSITRQIEKKLLKRGFQFNVIVVGMMFATLGEWRNSDLEVLD